MNDTDAKKVLEAVLFSSPDPLSLKQLHAVLGNTREHDLRQLLDELDREYESTNRTFRLARIGEGFQLRTLPMYKTWVLKSQPVRPNKLSPATLETLAIVAYRQPVTRSEVENVRGVDASFALRTLLERKLVRILGKDPGPGRAILYGTTREFLSLFNLSDLKELPTLADFDLPVPALGVPLESAQPEEPAGPALAEVG